MLNKVIQELEKLQEVKTNSSYRDKVIKEATEMYQAGWDALEDGIVISLRGNKVAIKTGASIVIKEMLDFNVRDGKLDGNVKSILNQMEVGNKKEEYLAQAIITKYYTIKRA